MINPSHTELLRTDKPFTTFVDVDNTLVPAGSKSCPTSSLDSLNLLDDHARVVLSTGRSLTHLLPLLTDINYRGLFVTGTGALLHHRQPDGTIETLWQAPAIQQHCLDIVGRFAETRVGLADVEGPFGPELSSVIKLKNLRKHTENLATVRRIVLVLNSLDSAAFRLLQKEAAMNDGTTIGTSFSWLPDHTDFHITANNVDKGTIVKFMMKKEAENKHRFSAIGDDEIDLPMLSVGGLTSAWLLTHQPKREQPHPSRKGITSHYLDNDAEYATAIKNGDREEIRQAKETARQRAFYYAVRRTLVQNGVL
jgi:HAD superfamily hydrolase (TIGR01484 family)